MDINNFKDDLLFFRRTISLQLAFDVINKFVTSEEAFSILTGSLENVLFNVKLMVESSNGDRASKQKVSQKSSNHSDQRSNKPIQVRAKRCGCNLLPPLADLSLSINIECNLATTLGMGLFQSFLGSLQP